MAASRASYGRFKTAFLQLTSHSNVAQLSKMALISAVHNVPALNKFTMSTQTTSTQGLAYKHDLVRGHPTIQAFVIREDPTFACCDPWLHISEVDNCHEASW